MGHVTSTGLGDVGEDHQSRQQETLTLRSSMLSWVEAVGADPEKPLDQIACRAS